MLLRNRRNDKENETFVLVSDDDVSVEKKVDG